MFDSYSKITENGMVRNIWRKFNELNLTDVFSLHDKSINYYSIIIYMFVCNMQIKPTVSQLCIRQSLQKTYSLPREMDD